jgi:uncharacterized SAM-binding protein YcdF (DUF218 family)
MVVAVFLKQLLLPPASLITLALGGMAWRGRGAVWGRALALAAVAALYALSTPLVAVSLLRSVQERNETSSAAQAIVILSAGLLADAPEYGGATVDALTLERVRFGATLARRTGLPVLVSGGVLDDRAPPIAAIMAGVLATDYGVKVKWVEANSESTADNAAMSAPLLKAAGVQRIYLVTHAWHMARARLAFERQGFVVSAAGTDYRTPSPLQLTDLLPSVKALADSYYAMHELIGLVYYRIAL